MKKYLLFAGHNYYPAGGVLDFIGDYDTLEEALEEANRKEGWEDYKTEVYDWWHVVDHDTMEIIAS